MIEGKHCYENAITEIVDGILKDNFFIKQIFIAIKHTQIAIKNAIKLYNSERLHLPLKHKLLLNL